VTAIADRFAWAVQFALATHPALRWLFLAICMAWTWAGTRAACALVGRALRRACRRGAR
jgi:hypothetical protein